jgi:hypothetical protein
MDSLVSSTSNDSSTAGGYALLAGTSVRTVSNATKSLAGTNERGFETTARARAKNPLALFARAELSRRRRRRRQSSTPHLRYGWFDRDVEQSLEIERSALSEPDEAELERLLAKHADIAEEAEW